MNSRWLDTTTMDKPKYSSPQWAAGWLVGRHPMLQGLLARVPDVIFWEEDYENGRSTPWVEVEKLKDAIRAYDDYCAAWEDYRKRTWEPQDEGKWEVWDAAGPRCDVNFGAPGVVYSISVMSGTERARLRLLATVGSGGVLFSISDLWGFDEEGRQLIADWYSLVMHQ